MSSLKSFPPKDPEAKLDYIFDWAAASNNTGLTDWLREGETILSYTVDVPEGIEKVSDEKINGDTSVLVWLEGGTIGETYLISCHIVTSQREDTRTAKLKIEPR